MNIPLFSVVVPTCHRNDLLARCLARLVPEVQQTPAADYEIIVTDDSRTRMAKALLEKEFPTVRYVEGPSRGPGPNRNAGVRAARGEWIAFTDDDCIPDHTWLSCYAAAIKAHPEQSLFEGRIYADRPRASLAEIAPINETGGYLWSSNLAIRRSLFLQVEGFDERYRVAMEDVDFRYRLEQLGHKADFIPAAAVCHPWRSQARSRDGWKKLSGYAEDTVRYLALHPEEARRLNGSYFLKSAVRGLVKRTLPGMWQHRGRGVCTALSNHWSELGLALSIFSGAPGRMRAAMEASQS